MGVPQPEGKGRGGPGGTQLQPHHVAPRPGLGPIEWPSGPHPGLGPIVWPPGPSPWSRRTRHPARAFGFRSTHIPKCGRCVARLSPARVPRSWREACSHCPSSGSGSHSGPSTGPHPLRSPSRSPSSSETRWPASGWGGGASEPFPAGAGASPLPSSRAEQRSPPHPGTEAASALDSVLAALPAVPRGQARAPRAPEQRTQGHSQRLAG